MTLKFNLVLNTFRMLLTVCVPLITFPYLAHVFGVEGMGKINFAISVTTVFTLFASLGIYTYGVRNGSYVRDSKISFSNFAYELLTINFTGLTLAYIIFFICLNTIPAFIENKDLLVIYGISIFFSTLGLDWVFGVYEDYLYITLRQIVVQLCTIVLMLLLVHSPNDIYIWAIASTVLTILVNVFNFFTCKKYIYFKVPDVKKLLLLPHLYPIFILFITQLAAKAGSDLNVIMLRIMTSNRETGLYSIVAKVINILITCFAAMTPVLVPKIVILLKENNAADFKSFIHKIFRMMLFIAIPAAIGLYTLSDEIIGVIGGKKFSDAAVTLRILAPVIVFAALNNVIYYNYFVPLCLEKYVLFCTACVLFLNLFLSFCLIENLLHNGTALGHLGAEFIGFILSSYIAFKKCGIKIWDFSCLYKYLVAGLMIFIYINFIKNFLNEGIIWTLIFTITGSMCLYFFVLYLLRDEFILEILIWLKGGKKG